MPDVDICFCCCIELNDTKDRHYVNFRYEVPGISTGHNLLVACVCLACGTEADDPLKFPAIEAIINARAIRFELPDKTFTP
jgi:hypothetical protein